MELNVTIPVLFMMLPFMLMSPGLIWRSQLLWFIICPIFIMAFSIKNLWVRAFLLWIAAWQIVIFFAQFSKQGVNPGPGFEILMAVMAGAVLYKFISEGNVPDATWAKFIRAAVIIQILIAIPQYFGHNLFLQFISLFMPATEKLPGHLVGTLGNRNYLAAFIAFSVPFFIGWRTFKVGKWTVNPALILIFLFLGFCLSPGTLAAILGMGFLMSYRLPFWKRMISLSLATKICVAYAAAYILTTGYHLNEFQALPGQLSQFLTTWRLPLDPALKDVGRFAMWMTAIGNLMAHPLFFILGFGPAASWGRNYPIHSQYISVWFQFGLVGLGLIVGYVITTYRMLAKKNELILLTALVIICLDSVANFPGQIAATAFLIVIILGLIERKRLNG